MWLIRSSGSPSAGRTLAGSEQEQLSYVCNSLAIQLRQEERIFLAHTGNYEGCSLTQHAIREKLASKELVDYHSNIVAAVGRSEEREWPGMTWPKPESRPSTVCVHKWLTDLLEVMSGEHDGVVVVVVDPSTFAIWQDQVDWYDLQEHEPSVFTFSHAEGFSCVA